MPTVLTYALQFSPSVYDPNDPEQPGQDDRSVVGGGDLSERALYGEAQLGQCIHQAEISLTGQGSEYERTVVRCHRNSLG